MEVKSQHFIQVTYNSDEWVHQVAMVIAGECRIMKQIDRREEVGELTTQYITYVCMYHIENQNPAIFEKYEVNGAKVCCYFWMDEE